MKQYVLHYDGPILTANRQREIQNRHALNKRIKAIKDAALMLFLSQYKGVKPTTGMVKVEVYDECKTARLRDIDAVMPTIKAVFDALQGVVYVDDSQIRPLTLHGAVKSDDKTDRVVFHFWVPDE